MHQAGCPDLASHPKAEKMPASTDVVIIGNGPSSMILSYILHGHIPFYDDATTAPHPDPLLHAKLQARPQLLGLDIDALTEHFAASRFSYSTQALPVNVLLDTLVRPNGDTDDTEKNSNIKWRYIPEKAVPHLVFGSSSQPGGQWTDNPTDASWEIQTLSYAGMLSLPGYTFSDHHIKVHGTPLPPFTRPTRKAVTDYLAAYPAAVGIDDAIHCGQTVGNISRQADGFYIGSHNIRCRHLVLASGIFSELIPPRPLLAPLATLPKPPVIKDSAPLLVIGSGFTAADIIISAPKNQKIIHIFKWQPETRPSPLRSCHRQAYPEYAGMHRLMKRAATPEDAPTRPRNRGKHSSSFLESREWSTLYEGFPNTVITDVDVSDGTANVTFRRDTGETFSRHVSGLAYAVGRRGSMGYLDEPLRSEIITLDHNDGSMMVSAHTLRDRAFEDLEIAKNVFIVGSLTGDSLVRFAYGGCVYAAGKLVAARSKESGDSVPEISSSRVTGGKRTANSTPVLNGIDGHNDVPHQRQNGHPLDRRKASNKPVVNSGTAEAEESSWWTSLFRKFN